MDLINRRQTFWSDKFSNKFSEKSWESEITWRLERAYELRKIPNEVEKYEKEILQLLPIYVENNKSLLNAIYRTGFIAFPSIIESSYCIPSSLK